jgi:hypothetical protein
MTDQDAWAREQVKASPNDPFWQVSGAILGQFDGLVAGYAYASSLQDGPPAIPVFGFQMLNAIGDLFQIIPSVVPSERTDWAKMTKKERRDTLTRQGHCSALIKIFGALEDLLMAHSSWFEYQNMNRIFKWYTFDWHAKAAAKTVSFSSYPGYLESLDDFYMMSSGLGMTQTSNGIPNSTLLELITPHSLLAWQRGMIRVWCMYRVWCMVYEERYLIPHTWFLIHHTSYLIHHTSYTIPYTSHIVPHTPNTTPYTHHLNSACSLRTGLDGRRMVRRIPHSS